jgi:hypothetical protein
MQAVDGERKISERCWLCTPLKDNNTIPSLVELTEFAAQKRGYDRCIVVTQDSMLDLLQRTSLNGLMAPEMSRLKLYMDACGAELTWPLVKAMDAMFTFLLHLHYEDLQMRTLLVTRFPWKPCVREGRGECNWSDEFVIAVRECVAYSWTGVFSRNASCCRGGTRVTPEGYGNVSRLVTGSGWRACELPSDGHRCCMVLVPYLLTAYFFDKWTGALMQNGVMRLAVRTPSVSMDQQAEPSVFECSYNPATNAVRIYDCMVRNGANVRAKPLGKRLADAAEVTNSWRSRGENSRPLTVLAFAPPQTVVRPDTADMVLFIKDSVPYSLHSGGDAFLWKRPSLEPLQVVVVCRVGSAMASYNRDNVLLCDVGVLAKGWSAACVHMGAYVCEPMGVWPDLKTPKEMEGTVRWRIVRPARRSERLFAFEECAAAAGGKAEMCRAQVSREEMRRLLNQISPK